MTELPNLISIFWHQNAKGLILGQFVAKVAPLLVTVVKEPVLKLRIMSCKKRLNWLNWIVNCPPNEGALCDGITIYSFLRLAGWLLTCEGFIWLL